MSRNPNIAVITIGYTQYAFPDTSAALEMMALLSGAVAVDENGYGLREITTCTHFLSEDGSLPKLEFIAAHRFNPNETVKEVKARHEREQADREDINQQMREAPVGLPAPAAELQDEAIH